MTGNPYLIGLCEVAGDLSGSIACTCQMQEAIVHRPLRHSAIIFCTRTQGHCNQHGMGEDIMG
jgi:hypothetical protein